MWRFKWVRQVSFFPVPFIPSVPSLNELERKGRPAGRSSKTERSSALLASLKTGANLEFGFSGAQQPIEQVGQIPKISIFQDWVWWDWSKVTRPHNPCQSGRLSSWSLRGKYPNPLQILQRCHHKWFISLCMIHNYCKQLIINHHYHQTNLKIKSLLYNFHLSFCSYYWSENYKVQVILTLFTIFYMFEHSIL